MRRRSWRGYPASSRSLTVREGDYVTKGQAIGRIVDSSLGYQSGAYGAQAAAAQAQAAQAEAELARTRYLYENGVYAKARLEQAEAAAKAARSQVNAALEQQKSVRAIAGQGVVQAPATGTLVLAADIPAGCAGGAGHDDRDHNLGSGGLPNSTCPNRSLPPYIPVRPS